MTIINFDEVKLKKTLSGLCKNCGKKRTRTINECQTINPFNKNTDGTPKNRFEVGQSVKENLEKRLDKFLKNGFVCRSCKVFLGY